MKEIKETNEYFHKILGKCFSVPLSDILKGKALLVEKFNIDEETINNMPYWMFKEKIKLAIIL